MTSHDQEAFWRVAYTDMHQEGHVWLDYASEQEQLFTFGAALMAVGPLLGARCLDAGCGRGRFARVLRALGARQVVATDVVEPTMERLRSEVPEIRWLAGTVNDSEFCAGLGAFDAVFALELLQYVPAATVFGNLWGRVAPGGRLVGVAPNADNTFVQRTCKQHQGLYAPLGTGALVEELRALPQVGDWGVVGLVWREDRSSVLYDLLPLTREPHWPQPPKRLLFLARRAAEK